VVPTFSSYAFLRQLCFSLVDLGNEVHVAASELRTLVDSIEPDLIDVHFSAAAFTVAVAKRKHWPVTIVTIQGLRFPLAVGISKGVFRFAEKWSSSRVDQFIVLTKDDYKALADIGVENCYLQSGYGFGCDLEKFDRGKISADQIMSISTSVGKLKDEIVIAYVGRLVAFKGFHLVVRAFLEAYRENKNIRLVVCGKFDDRHSSGLTEEEVALLENHPNIFMVGWTNKINEYLAVADFVAFPSEREGVPVNLMEALAMGVPVITCDSRGCREVMDNSAHGILLNQRSVSDLSAAILKMSTDHSFRENCAKSALAFRKKFDRMRFVKNHVKRMESLLA